MNTIWAYTTIIKQTDKLTMKKLLVAVFLSFCISPSFAQGGLGRGLIRSVADKGLVSGAQINRLVTQQTRFAQQLKNYQLVPLKINTSTTVQTALAVPPTLPQPQTALGTLLRSTYMQYGEADHALDVHFAQLNQPENAAFLYRGMHITDLQEIADIWAKGLPVGKTGYNSIYMTSNHAVARHYAKVEEGVPLVVAMNKSALAGSSLRPENMGVFYAEKDVPASAISDVFMLLDVNGKPAWHRVMWQDKLVFMPLAEQAAFTPQPQTQQIKITNLPGEPTVWVENLPSATTPSAPVSARVVERNACEQFLFPPQAGSSAMYIPPQLQEEENSLYRGLRLDNLDELKNILHKGLQVNKSSYSGEIFTTPVLWIALRYALPIEHFGDTVPVVIKLNLTPELEKQVSSARVALEHIFYRDIPASALSSVMLFLEVDGVYNWYEARLHNGQLVLTVAPGKIVQEQIDF